MKQTKKFISLLITLCMLCAAELKSAFETGGTFTLTAEARLRADRTMLPARFVAENLGARVLWDEQSQLVTIIGKNLKTGEDATILITIGADSARVNNKEIKLDSSAFIENDRTYTPIRFISENLGASVEWNESDKQVLITK